MVWGKTVWGKTGSERIATALVVGLAVCYCAYTAHSIYRLPPELRVQFIPDDAYYYLTLARNFVDLGQWSFDSGVSLTSGFHPLHAYALAAIYSLTRAPAEQFVGLGMMLSFIVALPAVLAAALLALRTARLVPGLMLLLFVLSGNISLNIVSAMEWSWVVALSAGYCLAFWYLAGDRGKNAIFGICCCGFLGSLARTDFGLLPAALAAASLPTFRIHAERIRFNGAVAGLMAASLGVFVGFLHNYLATGQYLQSSARMKSLWLNTYSSSVAPIQAEILSLFGTEPGQMLILAGILTLIVVMPGTRGFLTVLFSASTDWKATLWLGSLLTISGYIVFYSLNPAGTQHWYTAGLVVPVFLALSLPLIHTRSNHPVHIAALILLSVLVGLQIPRAHRFLDNPEWPHQVAMFRAGQFLHQAGLHQAGLQQAGFPGRIGSWNAGIIGYYEGGHIVNLDGLVNNDIYEYAKHHELPKYIGEKNIFYIVDFENMFSSEKLRRRGGYDSPVFTSRLRAIRKFDDRSSGWHGLTLYEVRLEEGSKFP